MEMTIQNEIKKENVIFVDRQPTPNAFFATLAAVQKQSTPLHKFKSQMRLLEKASEIGDIRGWQEKLQNLNNLGKEAGIDPSTDLETRIQLKKLELTLLFNAEKRAREQARQTEKKATEAQMGNQPELARELLAKAQKLTRLAGQIQDQLLTKTA